jgi:hypothetical protein
MTGWWTVFSVFIGSLAGTFLGPVLLEEWRTAKGRKLKARRKQLIRQIFSDSELPCFSLSGIRVACGCDEDTARELLLEMGAQGTMMKNGEEGWFFDRNRMKITTVEA